MMGHSKWAAFEAAKQEIVRRNLPPEVYQREVRRLCRKLRI